MKQAQIIPMLKLTNGALPIKVQTIRDFTEEQTEMNEIAHSHDYHEMIWLTNGQGILYADMQEHKVGRHTIFHLKPNQVHRFQVEPGMEGFVFSFTDSFFSVNEYDFDTASEASICRLFIERPTISIAEEMEDDMNEIVLKMIKEFNNHYSYRLELLRRYFKIFLTYLSRSVEANIQSTEQSRETELVRNFMHLLDKNYKEKKMVAEYARELLVTPNYLNKVIKKMTGSSAGYHIRQRVVLEAKRMGRYSGAGMKEIAYDLGFLDSAHFSKFFKTFGGTNFSEFKKDALVIPMNARIHTA